MVLLSKLKQDWAVSGRVSYKPVEGAFEPAVVVFTIVIVLGIAWVVWEFWLKDK